MVSGERLKGSTLLPKVAQAPEARVQGIGEGRDYVMQARLLRGYGGPFGSPHL